MVNKLSIFADVWDFLRTRKKWWLGPIFFVLILFGFLLVFVQTSVFAPFIYTLF
jgi:drug/metabolite transporter superfamily protein YnfA